MIILVPSFMGFPQSWDHVPFSWLRFGLFSMALSLLGKEGFVVSTIKLQSDSLGAINLLIKGCSHCHSHPCYMLVKNIHGIHKFEGNILRVHVRCEANQVADKLAENDMFSLSDYYLFDILPNFICNTILADATCISFHRGSR